MQYSGKFHGKLCFQEKVKKCLMEYSASKGNYRKISCQGEHNTQGTSLPELTSKVTTEFAYNGTYTKLYKEHYCRIEVTSELKCM